MKSLRLYNFIVALYGRLYISRSVPFWIMTPIRRVVRSLANLICPMLLKSAKRESNKSSEIIVSLTSFPERINEVWLVVQSMLLQTCQPIKILLWLSKDQFTSLEELPSSLLKLRGSIFQIRFVEGDIRSHKKFYYVAKEFSDSLVLLIDDDIFYPCNMIEQLMKIHSQNSSAIICRYAYEMKYDASARLLPYAKWLHIYSNSFNNSHLFFGSGGGTLFRPMDLYVDLLDKELFLNLTPMADDIWLNAMAKLANLPIIVVRPHLLLPIKSKSRALTLCKENVGNGRNDKQLERVSEYYKNCLGIDPFAK